VAVAQVVEH